MTPRAAEAGTAPALAGSLGDGGPVLLTRSEGDDEEGPPDLLLARTADQDAP